MIRLLILSPSLELSGGVSNYVKILHKNLDKKQFDVKIFHTGKSTKRFFNIFYPISIFYQNIKLRKILKTFQPEIVHLNPSLQHISIIRDFIFQKTIKKEGIPTLLLIHGWDEKVSDLFQKKVFRNLYRKHLKKSDRIVVLANKFKKKLINLGIEEEKIIISSTMVETKSYEDQIKKTDDSFKILFCANMKKQKGPFEILDSIPIIIKNTQNIKFIFIGDGPHLKTLKEKAKKLGITKHAEFKGYVTTKEKVEIFTKSTIFLFPSWHSEGFPTVIVEAMAAGLPIITTPVAGLSDVIINGKNGYLLSSKPANPRDIADKVLNLIENPALIDAISKNNKTLAQKEFSAKKIVDDIASIYSDLANHQN